MSFCISRRASLQITTEYEKITASYSIAERAIMATRRKSERKGSNGSTSKSRTRSSASGSATIGAAKGKVGIMTPGMGAGATTVVAGVEAIRKGLAPPIGSLTQMGTVRLGKRTDGRSPRINDFVPLAQLDDLVFTGWDIFEDDMYSSALNAGGLEKTPVGQLKPLL